MTQEEREFSLKKYNTSLCIDWPIVGTTYGKTVDVHGWYLSNFKDKEIKIYLKDSTTNQTTDVTSQVNTYKREDPINAMKGKGYGSLAENPEAGFDGKVSTANLKDGKHKIIVKVINKLTQDVMAQEEREFIYEKYKTNMYIDYPSNGQNYRNTLKIHGWVMSEEPNKKIRFFLNNTEITNKVNLIKRDDVIKGVVGYGTEKENPQPGFDATINVAGYTSGTYTFKVEVYSNTTGRLLKSDSTTFTLNIFTYNSGAFGISGLKEYNRAQGGDLTYYRIGDGNNVLFAVFSTHGFEDSWHKDGQELTDIAEKCIAHLREFQTNYQDILNNWTIYIIPKLNYDGQTFGWTNNGPGRTTIHSNAPGTKGIDLNRCWSVSYKSYSDNRNYNGTAPFQACEARYLRDFILSYKAQRGKTIVVDLHGWLNETIGDNGLGWFYRDRFGIGEHIGTYGGGYLINWARTLSNTRSVLVELPMITSHSQALNRQFAEKYIQATTNMLRNS